MRKQLVAGGEGRRLLQDLALLVEKDDREAFREAVSAQIRQLGTVGLELELAGPFAAFHFVGPKEASS